LRSHIITSNEEDVDRLLGDGPDGVDDAGEVAEEGEDEADPELNPAAELEEDPERRQDDGEDDVDAGRRAVRHLLDRSLLSRPPSRRKRGENHLLTHYNC